MKHLRPFPINKNLKFIFRESLPVHEEIFPQNPSKTSTQNFLNFPLGVLPLPYGTSFKNILTEFGLNDINDPETIRILNDLSPNSLGYKIRLHICELSIKHGASFLMTDSFGLRTEADIENSLEKLEVLIRLCNEANLLNGTQLPILVCLGPVAQNCYDSVTAASAGETKGLQTQFTDKVAELKKTYPHISVLFETNPEIESAQASAQAAEKSEVPYTLSFVVDHDGRLKDGNDLGQSVQKIGVSCPNLKIGINCFPIEGLEPAILSLHNAGVLNKLAVVYPNASSFDPTEFDGSDSGVFYGVPDVQQTTQYLRWIRALVLRLSPGTNIVLGGCCGTETDYINGLQGGAGVPQLGDSLFPLTDKVKKQTENACACH